MGINLGCFHIKMPQQLLHGANVTTRAEQFSSETVPEGVTGYTLVGKSGFNNRLTKCFSWYRSMQMVSANSAGDWVITYTGRWKQKHPGSVPISRRILFGQYSRNRRADALLVIRFL